MSNRLRRTPPSMVRQEIAKYANHVGMVVWSSNHCLHNFCTLFIGLLDIRNPTKGMSLWHVLRSDNAQLELLGALAKTSSISAGLKSEVSWAAEKAQKLCSLRNDVVHAPNFPLLQSSPSGIEVILLPHPVAVLPTRMNRLLDKPNDRKKLAALSGDLYALGEYAQRLYIEISAPQSIKDSGFLPSLPDRPTLQSLAEQTPLRNPILKKPIVARPRRRSLAE